MSAQDSITTQEQGAKNRYPVYALLVLIGGAVLIYLYLVKLSIVDGQFMPAWSDEYEYQKNMESFINNGTLITSIALEECYAKLLGSSGHGFAYTLINGLVARIVGVSNRTIIYVNFILITVASMAIGASSFLRAKEKLFILASLLLYPVVIFYSFTYMAEMYQFFFGVIVSLLIAGMYRRHFEGKPHLKLLLLFYAVILVATMYRQTWALWGIAALPLGRNRKQVACYSAGFFLLLAYAYLFSSYFLAYYPYDPRVFIFSAFRAGEIARGLSLVADNALNNIKLFFSFHVTPERLFIDFDYNFASRFSILLLSLYFAIHGVLIRKDRYQLVAALIVWATIIPVFLLFTTDNSAAQRHLAPLYYFIVIYTVSMPGRSNRTVSAVLLTLQLLLLVPVLYGTVNEIKSKKLLSVYHDTNAQSLASISRMISENIPEKDLVTIYVPNEIPLDDSLILYSLPTRADSGAQLRYTMNPLGRNMKLLNKVKVSYLIVPNNMIINDQNTELVAEAASIRLFRILGFPANGIISHLSMANAGKQE